MPYIPPDRMRELLHSMMDENQRLRERIAELECGLDAEAERAAIGELVEMLNENRVPFSVLVPFDLSLEIH